MQGYFSPAGVSFLDCRPNFANLSTVPAPAYHGGQFLMVTLACRVVFTFDPKLS